ncbi:hypothetical protein ACGFMM_00160 [Streptomyces sp. NPDC048604]|uniref:hypothetical protein n=1 Tax=Streptomyces sp. NPDC048604 TaxID=3365578 RepID=UPI003712BA99
MARVTVRDTDIVVRLTWRERLAARRGDIRVPLSALRQAYIEPDWWRALRGARGRGLWIPDRVAVGTRELPDHTQDFTAFRPGRPVLCLNFRPAAEYSRIAVQDPEQAEALRILTPHTTDPGPYPTPER